MFPIPESFVPDKFSKSGRGLEKFPKRHAQPRIIVSMKPEMIAIFPDFPCDRIQIAQSSTFDKLGKLPNNTMWLAYVEGSSSKHNGLHPDDAFGFFKTSTSTKSCFSGSVSFYLLPYNFRKLFSLLKSANPYAKTGQYPTAVQNSFTSYMHDIPSYYWPKIRDGLSRCKLKLLWPSAMVMPPLLDEIKNRHADVKIMAKVALEKLNAFIKDSNHDHSAMKVEANPFNIPIEDLEKQFKLLQAQINTSAPTVNPNRRSFASQEELGSIWFIIDNVHTVPIASMGEYTSKRREVFRDPFETEEDRMNKERVLFGNPYARKKRGKKDKKNTDDSESLDSVMNEAEEEASHEFEKESVQMHMPKKHRHSISKAAASLSSLPRQPMLMMPDYTNLTWDKLCTFQYQYENQNVDIQVDMHVDSIVQELEKEQEFAQAGSFVAEPSHPELLESSDSDTAVSSDLKMMELDTVDEPHDSAHKVELAIEVVSDDEEDDKQEKIPGSVKSWPELKRDLYIAISQWPKRTTPINFRFRLTFN